MSVKKFNIVSFILIFIESMLIGIGGILPGISGGVLCMIFGFYRPLMETLADPLHKLVPNLNILLPLALGSATGFLVSAGAVADALGAYETIATCAFVGLIIGTIPEMWQDAGEKGRTKGSFAALIITSVIFTAMLSVLNHSTGGVKLDTDIFWFFIAGAFIGLSIVVPGLAFSSTLMFFGLYEPLMVGVKELRLDVLLPVLVGIVITIVILPRLVSGLFEKYHSIVSHVTLGIVIGTTIPLMMTLDYSKTNENILAVIFLVCGALIAYAVSIFMPKLAKKLNRD
jgi:putative membrane protein